MCLVVFVACSSANPADPTTTTSATTTASAAVSTSNVADTTTSTTQAVAVAPIHPDLGDFDVMQASIAGADMWLAVADTSELRSRGLMGITDLSPLDGMIFIFENDTSGGFWMKDTLIPLDIAWFTGDGELVRVLPMVPCEGDPCPSYAPGANYLYAVEVPGGMFADLPADATIDF